MAPAMTGTPGQESATVTAASTGLRVSCACQADTAPTAGVCLSFLSTLLPVSHLNNFVSDGLSKPRNAFPFQHNIFVTQTDGTRSQKGGGEGGGGQTLT